MLRLWKRVEIAGARKVSVPLVSCLHCGVMMRFLGSHTARDVQTPSPVQ